MARKHPSQKNFRCKVIESEAYDELSAELETPLAQIIRSQLNRLVIKHLGAQWLDDSEQ